MQTWACTVAFLLYIAGIACVGIGAFFFSRFPSRTPPSEGSAIGDGITFFVGAGWMLTGFLFVGMGTTLLVLQEILGELRRQGRPAEKKKPPDTVQVSPKRASDGTIISFQ